MCVRRSLIFGLGWWFVATAAAHNPKVGLLTPYGIRVPTSSSQQVPPAADGSEDEDDFPSLQPVPAYEFYPSPPSAPPTLVRGPLGHATVRDMVDTATLEPCPQDMVEVDAAIYLDHDRYTIIKVWGVTATGCTVKFDRKWRDRSSLAPGSALVVKYHVELVSGEGVEFAHSEGMTCNPLHGRSDCELAGKLDVRKIIGDVSEDNASYAVLHLASREDVLGPVLTVGEGVAMFHGDVTQREASVFTANEGDVVVESPLGASYSAVVRAKRPDNTSSPCVKVSANELDVQGINGSRILHLDKDGNVFVAADTVVHVDSPSIGKCGVE